MCGGLTERGNCARGRRAEGFNPAGLIIRLAYVRNREWAVDELVGDLRTRQAVERLSAACRAGFPAGKLSSGCVRKFREGGPQRCAQRSEVQ